VAIRPAWSVASTGCHGAVGFTVGDGTGWYINSQQAVSQGKPAPVVVVLYDLGTWRGSPAYKHYDWYFPRNGSGFGHVSACTA
jgi:hypothetical protein